MAAQGCTQAVRRVCVKLHPSPWPWYWAAAVRSIVALGMAEVLARKGIVLDLAVGCSAGAMFGALIAQQIPAAEAVRIATTLWTAELTQTHRWLAIPQMVWPGWGRFGADFALRDDRLIRARLHKALGELRLEQLPIRLRVTATDAATGAAVVLRQGRVSDALRASIAMPFMFAPQHVDGQRLVDGFVSDPLPVSAADDAYAVIALGFEALMPQRVNKPSRLLAQTTSAMTNNLMYARLAAAEADGMRLLRIFPRLERRVGLFDTAAMPYLVEQGRLATEALLPNIIALLERRPQLVAA